MNPARNHTRPWLPDSPFEVVRPTLAGEAGVHQNAARNLRQSTAYESARGVLDTQLEFANTNNEVNLTVEQKYHLLADLVQSESRSEIAQKIYEKAGFKNLNDAVLRLDTEDELYVGANGEHIRIAAELPGTINAGIIPKFLTNKYEKLDGMDKSLSKLPRFLRERIADMTKSGAVTAGVTGLILLAGAPVSLPVILGSYLGSQGAKALASHFARNKRIYSEQKRKDGNGNFVESPSVAVAATKEIASLIGASMNAARSLLQNLEQKPAAANAPAALAPEAPVAPDEPEAPVAPDEPEAPVAPDEPEAPVAPDEPEAPVAPDAGMPIELGNQVPANPMRLRLNHDQVMAEIDQYDAEIAELANIRDQQRAAETPNPAPPVAPLPPVAPVAPEAVPAQQPEVNPAAQPPAQPPAQPRERATRFPDFNDPEVQAAINIAFQNIVKDIHRSELANVNEFHSLSKKAGWWEAGMGILGGIAGGAAGSALNANYLSGSHALKEGVWMHDGHIVSPDSPGAHLVQQMNGQEYFNINAEDIQRAQHLADNSGQSMGSMYHFVSQPDAQLIARLQDVSNASPAIQAQSEAMLSAMAQNPTEVTDALREFIQAHAIAGFDVSMLHTTDLTTAGWTQANLIKDAVAILSLAGAVGVKDIVKTLREASASAKKTRRSEKLFAGLAEGYFGEPKPDPKPVAPSKPSPDSPTANATGAAVETPAAATAETPQAEAAETPATEAVEAEEPATPEEPIVSPTFDAEHKGRIKGIVSELLISDSPVHHVMFRLEAGDTGFNAIEESRKNARLCSYLGLRPDEKFANTQELKNYLYDAVDELVAQADAIVKSDTGSNSIRFGNDTYTRENEIIAMRRFFSDAFVDAELKKEEITSITAIRKLLGDAERSKAGGIITEMPKVPKGNKYNPKVKQEGGQGQKKKKGGDDDGE